MPWISTPARSIFWTFRQTKWQRTTSPAWQERNLSGPGEKKFIAKRAGPIVGVLEGSFDAGTADKILNSITYSYSIKWVYQKSGKPKTVWGVPAGILTTVVKSLFFVVLLAAISVAAGIAFGVFRVMHRRYRNKRSSDQPEQDEITRLRLP